MTVPSPADPRPLHVQIAEDLRASVADGTYPLGSKLPAQREMAVRYGVAPGTMRQALDELVREGIMSAGRTRGTFVLALPGEPEPDASAEMAALRKRIEEVAGQARGVDPGPLLEQIGRIEANLMDLYGRLGFDYPREAPDQQRVMEGTGS